MARNGSRSKPRCMRPGPITNNGYLNFLRVYRKQCCGMTPQETIRRGAKKWMQLSEQEKEKYNRMSRRNSRSAQKSKRCMRPGPVTKNGYLNFLREFRKRVCGLTAVQTVIEGAKEWNRLSEGEKEKYKSRASGRQRSRVC